MYQEPKEKRVQIFKRLDLVDINVLHCKVVLDLYTGYCGNDGIYNYLYNEYLIQHSVIQGIRGDECQELHNGEEIIVQVDDAAIRVKLEGGKTKETYFFETIGTRTAKIDVKEKITLTMGSPTTTV